MKPETKVGILFLLAVGLIVGFAWTLGLLNPFSNAHHLNITYNYAGGIEVGSPVRVMGIKVGKVYSIKFDPTLKDSKGDEVKLVIDISVDKKAWDTIRTDSKFFINLAGIIGEKFIEISPGSAIAANFSPSEFIRGEDPPRVDQMISQGYGLAGKIMDLVSRNEGSVSNTILLLDKLVTNMNKTLVLLDKTTQKTDIVKLMNNFIQITDDVAILTTKLKGPEAEKTIGLLNKLVWRLDDLDKQAIKKFLQEEGIKAKLF